MTESPAAAASVVDPAPTGDGAAGAEATRAPVSLWTALWPAWLTKIAAETPMEGKP